MSVFFTSDLHLGHAKVAAIRGFDSVPDHDEWIVSMFRNLKMGDQLWVLGDVTSGSAVGEAIALDTLRYCHPPDVPIHLIAGNHDSVHPMHRDSHHRQAKFLETFSSVQPFARRKVAGRTVLLSHFPYTRDRDAVRFAQYRLRDEGEWLLHGHTHGPEWVTGASHEIHVGLDAWSRFVSLDEIVELLPSATL